MVDEAEVDALAWELYRTRYPDDGWRTLWRDQQEAFRHEARARLSRQRLTGLGEG